MSGRRKEKRVRLEIRLKGQEKDFIVGMAESEDMDLSDWVRSRLLDEDCVEERTLCQIPHTAWVGYFCPPGKVLL